MLAYIAVFLVGCLIGALSVIMGVIPMMIHRKERGK